MIEYDGYLDRSRLGPQLFSKGSLYSKRFFSDFERIILKRDGGWQDQIMATYGGIVKIYINKNGKFKIKRIKLLMNTKKLSLLMR